MPTRKQMDAVTNLIESLKEESFRVSGEFLRPVGRNSSESGTRWSGMDFEDRREAVYVNVDCSGFTLEQQMEVTDRVADGDPVELWLEGIQASDQRQHDQALRAEFAEERRVADGIRPDRKSLKAILAGEIPEMDRAPEEHGRGHER